MWNRMLKNIFHPDNADAVCAQSTPAKQPGRGVEVKPCTATDRTETCTNSPQRHNKPMTTLEIEQTRTVCLINSTRRSRRERLSWTCSCCGILLFLQLEVLLLTRGKDFPDGEAQKRNSSSSEEQTRQKNHTSKEEESRDTSRQMNLHLLHYRLYHFNRIKSSDFTTFRDQKRSNGPVFMSQKYHRKHPNIQTISFMCNN